MDDYLLYFIPITILGLLAVIFLHVSIFIKFGIIVLIALLYSIKFFREYLIEQELEDNYPRFLRDLAQYLEIGQPLNVAIKSLENNDYGYLLNKYIKSMIVYMNYGNTFVEALNKLAEKIRNRNIKESIYSLIEALNKGGDISGLLKSLSDSFEKLYQIKKDRLAQIRFLTFVYYGLFISVIFIIYLSYYFVTKLVILNSQGSSSVIYEYKFVSFLLLLVNSIFTGLVIGKVSTGRIASGIPHSIFLTLLTISVFFLIF